MLEGDKGVKFFSNFTENKCNKFRLPTVPNYCAISRVYRVGRERRYGRRRTKAQRYIVGMKRREKLRKIYSVHKLKKFRVSKKK